MICSLKVTVSYWSFFESDTVPYDVIHYCHENTMQSKFRAVDLHPRAPPLSFTKSMVRQINTWFMCYKRPVRCHSWTKCSFHYFLLCIRISRRILWNLPSSQTALSNGNQSKTGGKVLMHCFISSNCRSLPSHGIQISVMFKAWQNTTWIIQRMEPIGEYINIMGRTR